jgi:hypothetical protein|uniref:Uncharacterized protein n=1 Tax=Siphoviridae sp. ctP6113 TaxID=2826318 RepID=A0A8S5MUA1_9CAUD|nr:MAG TPA: hypothetical protein [Siphoviridae sp. ctP6113]
MKEFKTFQGANFTGLLGEKFRFCILNDEGKPSGVLLTGEVKKIYRRGGKTVVDLHLPELECARTYTAAKIYYLGRPREWFR